VSEPGDPRVDTGERTFYDVAGTRNIGYVAAGDPLLGGRLGFLSRRTHAFELQEVAVSGAGTGACSAMVSLTSDAAHPGERITRTFRSLPAEITAVADVLEGTAWKYDYGAGGSGDGGGTPVYALPAGDSFIFGFTPNPAVTEAHFSIGKATLRDPACCNVTIELAIAALGRGFQTPPGVAVVAGSGVAMEGGSAPGIGAADPLSTGGYSPSAQATVVTATWEDVPRTASDFIQTILNGATDPQKQVAAELRWCDNSDDAVVADADVLTDAGLHPFAALFDVTSTATRGTITDFTCALGKLQGVTTTGEQGLLRNGSLLFAALAPNRPTNGYPAVVDLGATGTALATVFQAGADGGWLREPPRSAVELHGRGALDIPTTSSTIGRLAVTGDFTIETWVRAAPIDPAAAAGPAAMFPRVIHANPTDEPNGARYILGLAPTHTLQFVTGTMIQADDSAVPAGLAEQRLFPYRDYSIQCYIRPNLETITPGSPAPIALRQNATDPTMSERLEIDATGILTLVVTQTGGQQARYAALTPILSNVWTMVTVARQGDALAIYTGPAPNAAFTGTLEITAEHSKLTVGGSVAASPFEMEMNQFVIANRSLSAEEVRASHLRLVPGTDPTLTLRWALDEGPPATRILNTAMATAGRYDSPVAGMLLWDFPGLFARIFAGSRDLAVQSRAAVASPNVWNHYATLYDTNFGIRLRGSDYGNCGTDGSLNVQDALSIEAWVVPDERPAGEEQVILSKFGRDAGEQAYEMGLDRLGRPYLLVRIEGETDDAGDELPENQKLHRFMAPTALPLDVAAYVVGTLELVELTDTTQQQNCTSVVGQIYVNGVPQLPGPARSDVSAPAGAATYAVSVLGGTGTGRYRPGDAVRIAPANLATFTRWYADADVLAGNYTSPERTITMPARDVTVTAIGVLDAINITQSGAPANIGRTATDQQVGRSYFRGRISELQMWSEALEPQVIATAYGTHRPAPPDDGLISAWSFVEQSGRVAYDSRLKNDALLSGSELWVAMHEDARMQLLLNGEPLDTELVPWTRFGTYGPRQVRFGDQLDDSGVSRNNLVGTVDEIRLWNGLRTLEQIRDSMHRPLAGSEDHLLGYWRFDAGSGSTVVDGTGTGNDARFVAPTPAESPIWVGSDAPVSNEAAPVLNALGGLVTSSVARITEGPAAFEYADSQRDSEGELFSVLKRGYIYRTATAGLTQVTGYKIGDLKQVYLGQVQTRPTLIGFIEGAPPLPSENLTRPYYADATSITEYAGIGSVKITDSETQTVTFGASRQDGRKIAFDLAFSGGGGIQKGDVIGLPGYGVEIQTTKIAGKVGAKFQLEWSDSSTKGAGLSSAALSADANSVTSGGNWEERDTSGGAYLTGERRYIPSNEGYALVKSMTADMYSLHLRNTGALVSLVVVPNLAIPQDVNVIAFPINPRYVKNGTLDGKVGLANDPDWTDANVNPGSYFRPAEAYALKNKIERETSQLLAYYRQFNAVQRGEAQNADLSDAIAGNPFYDWGAMLPKKDLVNSYVWSASGGMYSEQESTTNTRQESYAGSYSFSWALGPTGSLQFELFGISFELEANLSGGTSWTVNVSKEQQDESSMGLDVSISPDRMLKKYLGPTEPFYSREPAAGKVQSYRFMTFYLAPRPDNARDFFTGIVDQRWLRMSLDPAAAALLEAEAAGGDNPVWRILHRVTFVSRVPPQFQLQPAESVPVDVVEPANADHNALMIELVRKAIGTREPTPSIVGAAVRTVVTEDLLHVVPWWAAYLERAAVPNSAEARNLTRLLDTSIRYMNRYYESMGGTT
jgi:hypothetical protein